MKAIVQTEQPQIPNYLKQEGINYWPRNDKEKLV